MKLLVITQKVDKKDPILGFFHNWVSELSKRVEKISVICLEKGNYDLPKNVRIFSLGKESGRSKIKYVKNFLNLILGLHREYNVVFVHMNQEYILIGGFIWKILRKKIYFWRNHPHGNLLTRIAVWFSDKIFYTSPNSFMAKYTTKAIKMPVGVDTEIFKNLNRERQENSILFLGRISTIKNVHIILEMAKIMQKNNIQFTLDIVGDPVNPEDFEYKEKLIKENQDLIDKHVLNFCPAVPNYETPEIYNEHEIFINFTPKGSSDKATFEAAACGCVPFNFAAEEIQNIVGVAISDLDPTRNAFRIKGWFGTSSQRKDEIRMQLQKYVLENHSLNALIEKLCITIKKSV